jgi:hypothetical protein
MKMMAFWSSGMLLWKFPMEKWQQMLDLVNLVEYPLEPL